MALAVSSLVIGACVPGIVPLVLGRVHELSARDPDAHGAAWSAATTAFALGQAASAYGYSYLLSRSGSAYALLFALGAGAFLLAVAAPSFSARTRPAGSAWRRTGRPCG